MSLPASTHICKFPSHIICIFKRIINGGVRLMHSLISRRWFLSPFQLPNSQCGAYSPAGININTVALAGLYSANIVLIASNLLIVKSIICCKNQKHFNQFTMSLLFCVILFYRIFLPLYLPLSEFVNTGGTI